MFVLVVIVRTCHPFTIPWIFAVLESLLFITVFVKLNKIRPICFSYFVFFVLFVFFIVSVLK